MKIITYVKNLLMKKREISCWLDNLKREYTAEISQEMREDQAMNQCDYLLKKFGVIPPPIAKKLGTHMSAIVVEPRNNALPIHEKISVANNKSYEKPKTNRKQSPHTHKQRRSYENKAVQIYDEQQIPNIQENPKIFRKIQETQTIPIEKPRKQPKSNEIKENVIEYVEKKPSNENILEPKQNTHQITNKQPGLTSSSSKEPIKTNVILPTKNKLKTHETEAKQQQKIQKQQRDNEKLMRQIDQFFLVKKSVLFFKWQQKTSRSQRREFTVSTLSKLRLIRRAFKQWKERHNQKVLQRKKYEEECQNRIHSAKLQRLAHVAKVKLRSLTTALFFNKWLKRMRKKPSKPTEKKVPVYLRPPDQFKRKPSPLPIVADPRAEGLLKRANESKQRKIEETKERMKQDEKEKKRLEKQNKIEQKKLIEQHKKMLEHQHQERQKQLNDQIIANKKFEKIIQEKERMAKLEFVAKDFRRKHLFSLWKKAMKKLEEIERNSIKHHEKQLQKKVFRALTNEVLKKEEKQVKEAQKLRNLNLKRNLMRLFKLNVQSTNNVIAKVQSAIRPIILRDFFNEIKNAYIDSQRNKDFTAQSFYEKHLLHKALKAFPIGAKKANEDESREKKREDLMAKALQYLHENELKKTSEFNTGPLIKLDETQPKQPEIEQDSEPDEDYSDPDIF